MPRLDLDLDLRRTLQHGQGALQRTRRPLSIFRKRISLGPLDLMWHVLNFFGPAFGTGIFASALAKLIWRSELQRSSWLRLCVVTIASTSAVLIGGLLVFGHDGRVATYGAMVVVAALSLWWVGFRPSRS